jgi:fumarate reductase flavoprotein subunit
LAALDAQLIVVGGGASGLTAALTAAAIGVDVLIFEKSSRLGGNTQLSSGMLHAGGTRFQKAAGVEDSPEQTAADILAKNRNGSDPAVTLALCRRPETHGLPAHPRQHLWRSLHPRREGA